MKAEIRVEQKEDAKCAGCGKGNSKHAIVGNGSGTATGLTLCYDCWLLLMAKVIMCDTNEVKKKK